MKLRTLLGVLVVLTIAAGTAAAQTPITGSIKAGINFSTVTGDVSFIGTKQMRIAGVVGGGISTIINDRVGLDVDVLYSMEGVKFKATQIAANAKGTAEFDYIRIPLLLRIGAGSAARTGYILVGPSIGILTRARVTSGSENEDLKDVVKKGDLGIVFGAGTSIQKFFLEGRYTLGVTDFNKDPQPGDEASRHQVMTALAGVRF